MLKLPKINAPKFAKGFVLKQAGRKISQAFEVLGEKNVLWMIQCDKDIAEYVEKGVSAETLQEYRRVGKENDWVSQAITDEDLFAMLPEWAKTAVNSNENGAVWLQRQIAWLRSFFA